MEEKEIIDKIKEEKKLPKRIKEKIFKEIFECILASIIVYVYFIFLKLGIKNIHHNIYLTDLKVFGISLVIVAILFFEHAYNRKNNKSLYYGIETLVVAVLTMSLQYFIQYLTINYEIIIPLIPLIFNIYYILKAFFMIRKVKEDYRKEKSDIKEIVKRQNKKETRKKEEIKKETFNKEETKKETEKKDEVKKEEVKKQVSKKEEVKKVNKKTVSKKAANKKEEKK